MRASRSSSCWACTARATRARSARTAGSAAPESADCSSDRGFRRRRHTPSTVSTTGTSSVDPREGSAIETSNGRRMTRLHARWIVPAIGALLLAATLVAPSAPVKASGELDFPTQLVHVGHANVGCPGPVTDLGLDVTEHGDGTRSTSCSTAPPTRRSCATPASPSPPRSRTCWRRSARPRAGPPVRRAHGALAVCPRAATPTARSASQRRAEGARHRVPRPRQAHHAAAQVARGPRRPRHRGHATSPRRRPSPVFRRWGCTTPASGRRSRRHGVRQRADQGLRQGPARHRPAPAHLASSSSRSSTSTATTCRVRRGRPGRPCARPATAATASGPRAPGNCLQAPQLPRLDVMAPMPGECGAPGQPPARHRPQPQLRRVLGRPREPAALPRPTLPGRRALSEPETQTSSCVDPPGGHADHQPHVLEPRPAPAGRRAAGIAAGGPAVAASARRCPTRTATEPGGQALRHDGHDRGLVVQRDRRFRLHVRDRPAAVPSAVREVVEEYLGAGTRRGQGQPRGLPACVWRAPLIPASPLGDHRVQAPAGAVLRVKKSFATKTSQVDEFGNVR